MGDWKFLEAAEAYNRVLNPVIGASSNYAALGGATVSRVKTYQFYHRWSLRVQTNADNKGVSFTLKALPNETHVVSLVVRGTLPSSWDVSLDDSNYHSMTKMLDFDDDWAWYYASIPAAQANGSTTLYVRQKGSGSGDFYLDAVNAVNDDTLSTPIAGSLLGCEWLGTEHASTSRRSISSRAGGYVRDFKDDYGFGITQRTGAGAATVSANVQENIGISGGQIVSARRTSRSLILNGVLKASSTVPLDERRSALLEALASSSFIEGNSGPQPVRIWYTGNAPVREIEATYMSGLEGSVTVDSANVYENVPLQFIASAPDWYVIKETALDLDTSDTFAQYGAVAHVDGDWDNFTVPSAMTTNGIYYLAEDATYVYMGGGFTNGDGKADCDYIMRYHKQDKTYSAMDKGLNSNVRFMLVGPDDKVYVTGDFTADGNATAMRRACYWDGSSFTELANLNGICYGILFDRLGNIYLFGAFTQVGGVAKAYLVVSKDGGSTWAILGTGVNGAVLAGCVDVDGTLVFCGMFTTAHGATVNRVARWDPVAEAWSAMASGVDADPNDVVLSPDGRVFIAEDYIKYYDGNTWVEVETATTGEVFRMEFGPDGLLYLAGDFSDIGGLIAGYGVAVYNGAVFAHIGCKPARGPAPVRDVHHALPCDVDPASSLLYDLYIATSEVLGTNNYYAGVTTCTNDGKLPAAPFVSISRSGGDGAELWILRNERSGRQIWFDYPLQDGEEIRIDLRDHRSKTFWSSFWGWRNDAFFKNSDVTKFALLPGANDIACFVDPDNSPTVDAYILWRERYDGVN